MKNFFKKLSFVLAVAMVLTSLTPAVASAASKNFVTLKGNSSKAVTSVYAWIGGVTRNLDYNIGGKTSGVKGTWKSNNTKVVKVNASTGVLTPVANGTTTVTFTPSNGKNAVKTTVKVRTRAAALHIYDKAEYATGVKNPLEEKEGVTPSAIEMKVGDTLDLKVTMPLSKKQQDAGAKIASYFTYAEVDDNAVVEAALDPESNQRGYTLTAKAVGETTVTIVANQTTQANVRNGKYFREGKITVKVVDAFSAKQTGTNQITVTGTDLSDKVADYSLKLGNATRALSKAEKKEDGSVVLTAQASTLTAGTYTLTFGEKKAEIVCEASKVTSIVVEPEAAIMTATNEAIAYFKVLNQFGENVTKRTNLSVTGTDVVEANNNFSDGVVKFTSSTSQYSLNLTQLSLSIADKDSGVFYSKVLTVSENSRLSEATIKGVYKVNGNLVKEATLEEGSNSSNGLNDYRLLVGGVDQYGLPFDPQKMNSSSISLTVSGLTGLNVVVSPASVNGTPVEIQKVEVDGESYAAYPLTNTNTSGTNPGLRAGEATIIGYVLTSGKQVREVITVGGNVKIASLKIFSNEPIYGGTTADLQYEALDADGNNITDINVLRKFNNTESFKNNGVFFVGSQGGTAKLKMDLTSESLTNQVVKNLSWMSDTNVFNYVNLTVLPNAVPVAVVGVWTTPETTKGNVWLATTTATDGAITIKAEDLKYEDQYGNIIPRSQFDTISASGITVKVVTGTNNSDLTVKAGESIKSITSGSIAATNVKDNPIIVTYSANTGSAVTSKKIVLESVATVNGTTRTRSYTFNVSAVPVKECTLAASYDLGNNFYAVNKADLASAITGSALSVKVSYGNTRVRAVEGEDYTYSGAVEELNPSVVGVNATGKGKILVAQAGKGAIVSVDYTTGNAAAKVASSMYHPGTYAPGYATTTTGTPKELSQYVLASTQYKNVPADKAVISISNPNGTGYTVNANGTKNCSITFSEKGSYSIDVTYYWEGGYTFTDTLYFRVK